MVGDCLSVPICYFLEQKAEQKAEQKHTAGVSLINISYVDAAEMTRFYYFQQTG